ncbi:MAG: lysylphosphatidylglycerol synthase domain-containing protein, partial [Anaerotignaceae bacterium]
ISRKTHKLILWVLRGVFKSPKFLSYINLVAARLNGLETETKKVLKDKSIAIKLLIVQFMKISGWYLIPYFGFKAVAPSLEISLFTCFSIMALIVAIVGVIPLPGNAASTELLFSYMYSGMVEEATSVAGLVIYRATTYYVSFVIGAVIIISWLVARKIKEKREKVH